MKANYYFEAAGKLQQREFSVLQTNSDGTVHLGNDGEVAKVMNCKVADAPADGCCVLQAEPAKKEPEKKEASKK